MPTPLNAFDRGAMAVAVEGRDVYWIAPYSALAGVYRAPRTGGEPAALAPIRSFQDDGYDWDLAVADGTIFFVETGDAGVSPHPGRVARSEGPDHVVELAQGELHACRGGGHPRRVTLDVTQVYWTEDAGRYLGDVGDPSDPLCRTSEPVRRVRTVPRAGGTARTLAEVTSLNVVVDQQFVYFTRGASLLRLDKRSLVTGTVASGLDIGEPVLHQSGVWVYIGGRGGRLYAVHSQSGLVRTVWPGTGDPESRISDFASDEGYLYWTLAAGPSGEGGESGIYRAPRGDTGGPAELRIAGPSGSLAVDSKYLYWGEGTVYRRCK